jgi:hypothetical protein
MPETGPSIEPDKTSKKEDERFENHKVVELLHIDQNDLSELAERVALNNNVVYIAVHPFFEQNSDQYFNDIGISRPFPVTERKKYKTERIASVLRNLLSDNPAETPPVIIFEESEYFETTAQKVLESLHEDRKGYLVRTVFEGATPISTPKEDVRFDSRDRSPSNIAEYVAKISAIADRTFPELNRILTNAGVEQIVVGGMNLSIADNLHNQALLDPEGHPNYYFYNYFRRQKNPKFYLTDCVGTVVEALMEDFIVTISNFSAPHNRRNIKHAIGEMSLNNENGEIIQ